jgi:D-sedoheptulose 7-phosphate isomerase
MVRASEESINLYIAEVSSAIATVDSWEIERIIDCLVSLTITGKRIWIIGNGGSSATASHFAADLMRGLSDHQKYKIRATCLSESAARVTAIGNDFSFEEIFDRQIRSLASEGDILFLLSASGNSPNLIQGLRRAKEMNINTLSMVGFRGGVLKQESDICLHTVTEVGAYEIAEDSHSILCHYIAMNVRRRLDEKSLPESERIG